MNREIEFRGKDVITKEWVHGDLIHEFFKIQKDNSTCIRKYTCDGENEYHDVIPETIGQYTGLTDSKSKKIYEGDIVHYEDFDNYRPEITGTVVYTQDCMFEIEYYDKVLKKKETRPLVCHEHSIFASKKLEVIGNIYENLESKGEE